MITYIRKNSAIKSYLDVLPILLRKKHGKRKHYSRQNIEDAVSTAKLNDIFINYAFAIYLSRHQYVSLKSRNNMLDDYSRVRAYIAKKYFKGNEKFTIHDILKRTSSRLKYQRTIFNGNVAGEMADPDLNGDI